MIVGLMVVKQDADLWTPFKSLQINIVALLFKT